MSMLNDSSIEGESFSSSWKRTRSVVEASSQTKTNNNPTRDKSYQSIKKNSVEVQTEDLFDTYSNLPETVPSGLPEFLARVEPLVTKELRKNITSQAFNGYDVSWAAVHKAVSCVHTLQNVDFQKEQMECTGLSWNCVGSVIAAIYGRHDHEDWCTHKGAFCMWNIDRPHLNPGKPDFVMETPACMTSIAFHPTEPTLIAGGYFNGEVVVWNLGLDEDTQLAASDENSHREPVTQVQWIIDPKSRVIAKYHLVSVSSDGKMLRWQVPVRKQNLKLLDGFMLLGKNNVDVLKMKESEANREVGVTSVSFSPTDKSSFSLGSENGGIFLCSLNDTGTPITGSGIDSELMSLVTIPLEPHKGAVSSVATSPFSSKLLLTCSFDGTVKIFKLGQENTAVFSADPSLGYLHSAVWSYSKPLTFAVATGDGYVLIYDLSESQSSPLQKLKASPELQPVHHVTFNPSLHHTVASADKKGVVKVWQLSDSLTYNSPRALQSLNLLASSENSTKAETSMK